MDANFDPVTYAHRELAPLLRSLCDLARSEGEADQHAFFTRVLSGIETASDGADLAAPFMELSTTAFLGFRLSLPAMRLVDRVLEEAQQLAESLSLGASDRQ